MENSKSTHELWEQKIQRMPHLINDTEMIIGQNYHISHREDSNINIYARLLSYTTVGESVLDAKFRILDVYGLEMTIQRHAFDQMCIVDTQH